MSGISNAVVKLIEILKRSVVEDIFFFEVLLKGKENIKTIQDI